MANHAKNEKIIPTGPIKKPYATIKEMIIPNVNSNFILVPYLSYAP